MTQETALSILKTGRNVFLTGEPGSGKTHTVNRYIQYLKQLKINTAITASTGIAATHINGMTIHSWSGIGVKKNLNPADIKKIIKYRGKRINKASVLIIDEISMLDASVLDLADTVCRAAKKSELSFGGVQVVFVGDFFQLPPVRRKDEEPYKFAFESEAWQSANPAVCYLTEQYRQSDPELTGLLFAIRSGCVLNSHRECLNRRLLKLSDNQKITKLFPHNADVDEINLEELNKLPGSPVNFIMKSKGNERSVEQLKKGCLSPENLKLKKGAVVMFTKNNFELGYVNGTVGTIVGFDEDDGEEEILPIVQTRMGKKIIVGPAEWAVEDNGEVVAKIEQLPLRLAWAMTIHKSQGATLDEAFVDLSGAFVEGQGYVALSRVRTLGGLYLNGYNEKALKIHPAVARQDSVFNNQSAEIESEFSRLSDDDLTLKHNTFILSVGGELARSTETLQRVKEKAYSVENVRKTHPNAYCPWGEDEDENLVEYHLAGRPQREIAQLLGRNTGAIRSRLVKLGLIDY